MSTPTTPWHPALWIVLRWGSPTLSLPTISPASGEKTYSITSLLIHLFHHSILPLSIPFVLPFPSSIWLVTAHPVNQTSTSLSWTRSAWRMAKVSRLYGLIWLLLQLGRGRTDQVRAILFLTITGLGGIGQNWSAFVSTFCGWSWHRLADLPAGWQLKNMLERVFKWGWIQQNVADLMSVTWSMYVCEWSKMLHAYKRNNSMLNPFEEPDTSEIFLYGNTIVG